MSPKETAVAEWYYIGHYGQLGPLTKEQIDELVEGGVIARDTYVWRTGMSDWLPAERVAELQMAFKKNEPFAAPPPPPAPSVTTATAPPFSVPSSFGNYPQVHETPYPAFGYVKSDKSRILAGILQLILPGVGRIYLGYAAIGILQLVLSLCFGVGYIWSLIDGIIMLTGGVRMDGYGRALPD